MPTFNELKKVLTEVTAIPPTEWLHFVQKVKIKNLDKNENFFNQGEEVHELGFVLKGLLYNYIAQDDGSESVKVFLSEGMFVAPYSSLIQKVPAIFSCKALEPTKLLYIDYSDMENLYDRHICWQRLGRLVAEKNFIAKERRELEFLQDDAKTRYSKFLVSHKNVIDRLPQYLVASFIGISAESLSRIRRRSE